MDNSTYVALSQLTALERQLDVTANNIANANSTGFKAERVLFESYLQKDDASLAGEGMAFDALFSSLRLHEVVMAANDASSARIASV